MLNAITRFIRDEEGATAIEYGIIAGMMAILLAFIFNDSTGTLAVALKGVFSRISTSLGGAAGGSGT
ncbi:Flp family type IVb pilin [Variovorax sp.]|jgi:pilus assembly protein Flp/PilA|uniref:Flp family type IVb pilin n=1 Tax=Variovorax sp. TaxID=1871043 RepID=UPI0012262433|nr:Flp family type IVb pilin [Variovorax sp.]TAJ57247.1 MAG: Flp family type IVb pilin [Variovorax sp.]